MHPYAIAPMSIHPAITAVTLMIIMSVDVRLLSGSTSSSPPDFGTLQTIQLLINVFFSDIMLITPNCNRLENTNLET